MSMQELITSCCPCVLILLLGYLGFRALGTQRKKKKQHSQHTGRQRGGGQETPMNGDSPLPSDLPSYRLLQVREAEAQTYSLTPKRGQRDQNVDPDKLWLPSGQSVAVAGITISKGLIYVGSHLPSLQRYRGMDPALVNPALDVTKTPAVDESDLGYWPSYSGIPSRSRWRYLSWLASERSDPSIPIGYVFLYFYGLERRILADARSSAKARAEVPILLAEVRRLLSIYGENHSFHGYATSLLATAQVLFSDRRLYLDLPDPDTAYGYESSVTALAIGQLRADEKAVPGPWALAWFLSDPTTRKRTPVSRCFDEFERLFFLKFSERHPDGIKLPPPKGAYKLWHHPASASFGGHFEIPVAGVSDTSRLQRPVNILQALADECADELDPYSRLLGARPPTEPVEVSAGRAVTSGVPIPPPPKDAHSTGQKTETGFDLDMAAVEAKLRDTAEVSSFLTEIFEEEDEPPLPAEEETTTQAPEQGEETIAGLDSTHSQLLRLIAGREEVSRSEFEKLAEALGLMPDGALDTINDAAFDVADAPLFEGDDPIEVDQDVLTEMSQGDEP